jgi:hypothetical protein
LEHSKTTIGWETHFHIYFERKTQYNNNMDIIDVLKHGLYRGLVSETQWHIIDAFLHPCLTKRAHNASSRDEFCVQHEDAIASK